MIRNLFFIFFVILLTIKESAAQNDPFTRSLTKDIKNSIEIEKEIFKDNKNIIKKPNVDLVLSENLDKYILKATALSILNKLSEKFFIKKERENLDKIDIGNIPTKHLIKSTDTLESIAKEYGFTVDELKIANGIISNRDELNVGNYLILPKRYHVVKKGDTLKSIAKTYNIDPAQLAAFNNLKSKENILIRERLQLPFFIYYNNIDQSLAEIAKKFDRTVNELRTLNKYSNKVKNINKDEIVKIPIYVNVIKDYQNLNTTSIYDFNINPNNRAIIEIYDKQFMINEGSKLGNKGGVVVSIQKDMIIVLENNKEFIFQINAPINSQRNFNSPIKNSEVVLPNSGANNPPPGSGNEVPPNNGANNPPPGSGNEVPTNNGANNPPPGSGNEVPPNNRAPGAPGAPAK